MAGFSGPGLRLGRPRWAVSKGSFSHGLLGTSSPPGAGHQEEEEGTITRAETGPHRGDAHRDTASPLYTLSSCERSTMPTCIWFHQGTKTCAISVRQVSLQLALRLLLLTIRQLHHLPPPLPPPVGNSSCLFSPCQPLYASYCTVLLCFSRYYIVRLKMFYFLCFLMYYLCEKYKPMTVQYYIANCVSWYPG